MDLFEKAMTEYKQKNPTPIKKEICLHARTMRNEGWETCTVVCV